MANSTRYILNRMRIRISEKLMRKKGCYMKKYYKLSRIVILILTIIISLIITYNEHISVRMVSTTFCSVVAFITSFFTTPISNKMIVASDFITKRTLRIMYYITLLPVIIFVALFIACWFIQFIYDNFLESADLSVAVLTILCAEGVFITLIMPYIQLVIVQILRFLLQDKKEGCKDEQE